MSTIPSLFFFLRGLRNIFSYSLLSGKNGQRQALCFIPPAQHGTLTAAPYAGSKLSLCPLFSPFWWVRGRQPVIPRFCVENPVSSARAGGIGRMLPHGTTTITPAISIP